MKKEITFKIETTLDEKSLAELLSGAMSGNCGFDWWKLNDTADYETAKKELVKEIKAERLAKKSDESENDITIEEVWSRILFNGGKLLLLEPESDWHWSNKKDGELVWSYQIKEENLEPVGGIWHMVGLDDIVKGLKQYFKEQPANGYTSLGELLEFGDYYDMDAVFQYAAYDEIMFG